MNPKLKDGWKDLEKTYTTQIWDSYVQFRYVGNSTFQITVFIGECTPKNMKAFLDTAAVDPGTSLFAITLTQCQAKASHLVIIIFILPILLKTINIHGLKIVLVTLLMII